MNVLFRKLSKRVIVLFVAAMLVIMSACSSPSTNGNGSSGTAKPKDLTFAWGGDPTTMDPQNTTVFETAVVQIFENLVAFNGNMEIVPQLAKSWEHSSDNKNWTFTLREGVKFQDGTPFNADAVKKSFDRVTNPDNKLGRFTLLGPFLDNITVESDTKVTFHLKEPYGPILNVLAHPGSGILSPKSIQEGTVAKNPVGTGPYKLKQWTPGDSVVFEPYPDYWGGKPKLNSLTFKTVKEGTSRVIMLENGEADVIAPVPISDIDRLKKSDKVSISTYPSSNFLYIGINNMKAPFNDVKVRQALNYAIDKDAIVKKIFMGTGKAVTAAIAEKTWGYSNVGAYPYNKEKAKQLLQEAGVKEGTTIKLWTTDGSFLNDRQTAEFVQNSLQEVGLKVELTKWEFGAFFEALKSPDKYDLYLREGGPPTNDADWIIRSLFSTGNAFNHSRFSNPDADKLIQAGLHETNVDARKKIYADLLTILKDQAAWLYLVEEPGVIGTGKNVKDVVPFATGIIDFKNAVKN
ncbi:glutathione ABC transporter substrate-binding protein [Paenibacillus sp. GP183]|uniref:glutathione ABC transporter substrate-binding protein n=1 Tax=Paenibacillus sp. GP183 TaxID=1882751 RepID=UPI000898B869|nr:glutathione ABC transporter substrate-binding protein [Paenibacillus sp. GP183]SED06517.1 peptide/nickel transport system substrate-binding protein [Paenibacillus sp. GP183]